MSDSKRKTESSGSPPESTQGSTEIDSRWGSEDLIDRIKDSADKLARDRSSRGDLKILSRALRELRYAFKVFSPYRNRRIVSVFGSARTAADDPCYEQAAKFGRAMAKQDWLVLTGAASGIMEAGHQGAGREHSMGLNIMLPFEQDANPVIAGDHKLVHMKYFFTRKLMFVKECDAVACFPGGFGTLDEALEVLTLLQTGKRDMVPVVLIDPPGQTYWQDFHHFVQRNLLADKMISPDDLSLYKMTHDPLEAVDEILRFFQNYHSMRYVDDRLVLRLLKAPTDSLMQQLQEDFGDLLAEGDFQVCKALDQEQDQPDLADLPRLAFRFNRRSLGRLRQLIDTINGAVLD